MITAGEGKYKVFLEKHEIDDDLIYILGGGEKSHIGGIVICEPGKDSKVIKLEGHYDYMVLEPIALEASEKYNKKVVAIGGIHVDNATKDEIELLIKNCKSLANSI